MPTYSDSEHGRLVTTLAGPSSNSDSNFGRLVTTLTAPPPSTVYSDSQFGRLVVTIGVVVQPIPTKDGVEPETVVAVTGVLAGGGNPDSWIWRQVSGPTVALQGTGANRTFRAPSVMVNRVPQATTVILGVKAKIGTVESGEITATFNILPNQRWMLVGSTWVGRRKPVNL